MGSETTRFRTMLTVPNGLSVLRLLGVPVFLWLVLVPEADGWALLVLALSGFTDWLDGQLARAWRQTSRFGELLDPAADRLYILAVLLGFSVRGIIPIWLAAALVLRDVVLVSCILLLRRHGYSALPVHFLGKAATFNLLYAFPLLLLGGSPWVVSTIAKIAGWAFAVWGTALYLWAGALYVVQVFQLVRLDRAARRSTSRSSASPGARLPVREPVREDTGQAVQSPARRRPHGGGQHVGERGGDAAGVDAVGERPTPSVRNGAEGVPTRSESGRERDR